MQFLEKQWKMYESTDIKLVTTVKRRNQLVSESNYHTTNAFQKIWWQLKWKRQK